MFIAPNQRFEGSDRDLRSLEQGRPRGPAGGHAAAPRRLSSSGAADEYGAAGLLKGPRLKSWVRFEEVILPLLTAYVAEYGSGLIHAGFKVTDEVLERVGLLGTLSEAEVGKLRGFGLGRS